MHILDFEFCLKENTSHIYYKMNLSNDILKKDNYLTNKVCSL
jgi:hypothetical protein